MAADPVPTKSSDFAALAKRISVWTTNSLLTLIVLVAGLGFGRQVLQWWATDDAPVDAPLVLPAEGSGNLARPHVVQFGDSPWSMRRQSIEGSRDQMIERLRLVCREMLNAAPPEGERAATVGSENEKRLMARLSQEKPAAESSGRWRLYEFHEAFPMAVGIAEAPSRVLLWGLAIPKGPADWTLCAFQPENGPREGVSGAANVPLPPGARRTMALRVADGGAVAACSGEASPSEWTEFYDDWGEKNDWRRATDWQAIGTARHARFVGSGHDGGTLDIRFGPDAHGRLTGLLMLFPRESR